MSHICVKCPGESVILIVNVHLQHAESSGLPNTSSLRNQLMLLIGTVSLTHILSSIFIEQNPYKMESDIFSS